MAETTRAVYERQRRKKIAEQRRKYLILSPWLQNMYPETFLQFNIFFEQLKRKKSANQKFVDYKGF